MNWEEERRRLIEALEREGILKEERVKEAMLKVPRHEFVPPNVRRYSYEDSPLPIGFGQTISAPHMVAIMTQLVDPKPGERILEIGTGSGYQAAILAELVGKEGLVVSVEYFIQLAKEAYWRLRSLGYDNVLVVCFDGSLGFPPLAPYDKILVTCASPEFPWHLVRQLKREGILVVPCSNGFWQSLKIYKEGKVYNWGPVAFVPMRGRKGYRGY